MSWDNFIFFAVPALACWTAGSLAALRGRANSRVYGFLLAGVALFFSYILCLWVELARPPMATMGETRLWYSLFLPMVAGVIYRRWHYKLILSFATLMSAVFIGINLLRPEIQATALMPALQSPWFVPHVIAYMFAYALLGAAAMTALYLLVVRRSRVGQEEMLLCDNLTNAGVAFMTLGMLMGAVWAKDAWGHYWAWDPKETWASATWLTYLAYIHLRIKRTAGCRVSLTVLIVAFVLLQMCWWGIDYLPSAQGMSTHTYN